MQNGVKGLLETAVQVSARQLSGLCFLCEAAVGAVGERASGGLGTCQRRGRDGAGTGQAAGRSAARGGRREGARRAGSAAGGPARGHGHGAARSGWP